MINTFFSSFCNDKAFAIKTLPSFWNPQDDKWPGPPWGGKGSVFYILSDLLWVWERSWCEIRLGKGGKREKGEKFPTKNSFCLKCQGLSPITIDVSYVPSSRSPGILENLDSLCHITGREIKPTQRTRPLLCRNGEVSPTHVLHKKEQFDSVLTINESLALKVLSAGPVCFRRQYIGQVISGVRRETCSFH